jgi:hypothetical protein
MLLNKTVALLLAGLLAASQNIFAPITPAEFTAMKNRQFAKRDGTQITVADLLLEWQIKYNQTHGHNPINIKHGDGTDSLSSIERLIVLEFVQSPTLLVDALKKENHPFNKLATEFRAAFYTGKPTNLDNIQICAKIFLRTELALLGDENNAVKNYATFKAQFDVLAPAIKNQVLELASLPCGRTEIHQYVPRGFQLRALLSAVSNKAQLDPCAELLAQKNRSVGTNTFWRSKLAEFVTEFPQLETASALPAKATTKTTSHHSAISTATSATPNPTAASSTINAAATNTKTPRFNSSSKWIIGSIATAATAATIGGVAWLYKKFHRWQKTLPTAEQKAPKHELLKKFWQTLRPAKKTGTVVTNNT